VRLFLGLFLGVDQRVEHGTNALSAHSGDGNKQTIYRWQRDPREPTSNRVGTNVEDGPKIISGINRLRTIALQADGLNRYKT
jgi:hypothetical protein